MACSPRFDITRFPSSCFSEYDQIFETDGEEDFDDYISDDDSEQEVDESINAADELLVFIYENNLTSNVFDVLGEE